MFISAVLRVQGRLQNPRQTPVRTKLRLKRVPIIPLFLFLSPCFFLLRFPLLLGVFFLSLGDRRKKILSLFGLGFPCSFYCVFARKARKGGNRLFVKWTLFHAYTRGPPWAYSGHAWKRWFSLQGMLHLWSVFWEVPSETHFPFWDPCLRAIRTHSHPNYHWSRAAKRGCFKRGGFPIWTCPSFFVFFVLFGTFPIFLGISWFARRWSGDFPDCPFPLSRPIKSTYEEQSRKGPRHNLDLSRKKWETPGFGNPPV